MIHLVILIILHRRDVVAVAVNARMLVLGRRMLRISPILNNVFRNVSPLVNVTLLKKKARGVLGLRGITAQGVLW